MPMKKGGSKKVVSQNIKMEMNRHPDMPQNQAIAIAMDMARKSSPRRKGKKGS